MAAMIALTDVQWVMVALLIACYLAICVRTALRMAHTGRSFWKWLSITVFLTSIPATVVLMREQMRHARAARRARPRRHEGPDEPEPDLLRCRHCGKLVRPADLDHTGGLAACPFCRLPVDDAEIG